MKLKILLASLGLGAGLMYFLDPQQGNRRRAMVRDRVNSWVSDLDDSINAVNEDVRNRARGVLAELSAKLSEEGIPDWILEARVRTNLGRLARNAGNIQVEAHSGRILLTGAALRGDVYDILNAASRTRGVHSVENNIQLFDGPQDIPALQSSPSMTQRVVSQWQEKSWSPATRLLSGVGGSLLTLYGLKRSKGLAKPVLSTAGLILATRSVTNKDPRSLVGLGESTIRVHKAININAPIDEVYRYWRDFENFPLFMEHVKKISVQDDGISNWRVEGPAGASVEFQSHITKDIPNEVIAWETLPESQVHHSGFVRFDENWNGSTRVTVQMNYLPPAGALGDAVAQLFDVDPHQAMDDDLLRLKTLLEGSRMSTGETEVELKRT